MQQEEKYIKKRYDIIKTALDDLKKTLYKLYVKEKEVGASNSLIFIKRNLRKVLFVDRLMQGFNIDTIFEDNKKNESDKEIKEIKEIQKRISGDLDLFKDSITRLYNKNVDTISARKKYLLEKNMDYIILAEKNLKFFEVELVSHKWFQIGGDYE